MKHIIFNKSLIIGYVGHFKTLEATVVQIYLENIYILQNIERITEASIKLFIIHFLLSN